MFYLYEFKLDFFKSFLDDLFSILQNNRYRNGINENN